MIVSDRSGQPGCRDIRSQFDPAGWPVVVRARGLRRRDLLREPLNVALGKEIAAVRANVQPHSTFARRSAIFGSRDQPTSRPAD